MAAANRLVSRDAYAHVSSLYRHHMTAVPPGSVSTSSAAGGGSGTGGGKAGLGMSPTGDGASALSLNLVSDSVRASLRSGVPANRAGGGSLAGAGAAGGARSGSSGPSIIIMPDGDFARALKQGAAKVQAAIKVRPLLPAPGHHQGAAAGYRQGQQAGAGYESGEHGYSGQWGGSAGAGAGVCVRDGEYDAWAQHGHAGMVQQEGLLPPHAAPTGPSFDVDDMLQWAAAGME
jgi:hypothetical protein